MNNSVAVSVTEGDISKVPADALITAINSGKMWNGGIDNLIYRVAGGMFHAQAQESSLIDGMSLVAKGGSHQGKFKNVVFVVDDLKRPLREIVYAGLLGADNAGFTSVTLPTIRMGVMLGVVERSIQEAIAEMVAGVQNFLSEGPQSVQSITFVVYNDAQIKEMLGKALNS